MAGESQIPFKIHYVLKLLILFQIFLGMTLTCPESLVESGTKILDT